jgi:integrase
MSTQQQEKPKVNYADFLKGLPERQEGTVAWVIERFIDEMNGTGARPAVRTLSASHFYTLRLLQRSPIGRIVAKALTHRDVIAHAQLRIKEVQPPTVLQDITFLTGALKYAGSAWEDCEGLSSGAIEAAKPYLIKHNLMGKSQPRERRVSNEEVEILVAWAVKRNENPRTVVDMVRVILWQFYSSRRIGETCRLLWADWDREAQTILVRKMKDPKNRDKNKVVALTNEAQAMLVALWDIRDESELRIFPYNRHTCIANYVQAKHDTGIEGLHLHDSRAERATRLVEDEKRTPAEAILVTGHETTAVFERTYMRLDPRKFKRPELPA